MSEHVLEHLSAYVDGALSAAESERFRSHLGECAACAKRLQELAEVDAGLRDLPVGAPAGYFESLPARIRTRLSASSPPQRRLSGFPLWTLATAAALMLAVLAPLTLRERRMRPAGVSARLSDQPAPAAAEADKLVRTAQAPPATTMPTAFAPRPAATAAPAPDDYRRTAAKARDLEKKAEAVPSRTEEAAVAPAAPAPPPQVGAAAPAAGFAEPPRQAAETQQFGPRANQQAEQRRQGAMKQSAGAPAEAPEASGRVAGRAMETKDAASAPERAVAKSDKETGETERFRDLSARAPRDAAAARALRESWRRLAAETRDLGEADEARVQAVEMSAAAWRFEKLRVDRSLAERDAALYLARADARQPARVRELLASLSR